MARRLSALDVYHKMTGIFFLKDTATTTTTNGTATKGTKVIDFTSAASFTVGDEIRIGDNGNNAEVCVIDIIAVNTVTMKLPFSRDIANGEDVTLLEAVDLGATDENGVNLNTDQDEVTVEAGTQQNTYLFIPGNLEEGMTWNLRDFNAENIASSVGLDETDTDIVDANGVVLIPNDFISETFKPWKFEGLLEGGEAVTGYVYSAKVSNATQALQFAYGVATVIPYNLRSNGNRAFLIE